MTQKASNVTHRSGTGVARLHPRPCSTSSARRIPAEILNLIVSYMLPRSLGSILLLDKECHQAYSELLYRNVDIWSPRELVNLFHGPNAVCNLSGTLKITIERAVFLEPCWANINKEFEPAEYLGRVLAMAASVQELALDYLYPDSCSIHESALEFEWNFRQEISVREKDPTFLPCLTRLKCPGVQPMLSLCRGRPVESISHVRDVSDPIVCPFPTQLRPIGVPSMCLSISTVAFTTPSGLSEVNAVAALSILARASEIGLVVKRFKITVVGDTGYMPSLSWRERDWPTLWTLAIPEKGGHEHLESLQIVFDPPPKYYTLSRQHMLLERVVHLGLSNLTHAVVGSSDSEWRKDVKAQANLVSDPLLNWTPRPNRGGDPVLRWWLHASRLFDEEVPDSAYHDVLVRLRGLMLIRWDDGSVPSVEELREGVDTLTAMRSSRRFAWMISTFNP